MELDPNSVRRRLAAALGVALVLVLVGCSEGDPEPEMAPTQSVASTPSGEPSESETPPEEAPEDVVREFIRGYNEALASGDTSRMREKTAEGCRQCEEHMRPIEEVHEAGGRFDTHGWQVVRTKLAGKTTGRARVQVAVRISGGRTVPAAGEDPVVYEADRRLMLFKLARENAGPWLITFIGYYS
ncbi:hypothetical protein [Nocardioides ferulae]|uniref:hypothetical protein n=1 Tax=Nocardioides ferulae TaxID=2340821 RepID=UPI000EAF7FBD|nr:hypothetical protein [Nocardioides ferulae]